MLIRWEDKMTHILGNYSRFWSQLSSGHPQPQARQ